MPTEDDAILCLGAALRPASRLAVACDHRVAYGNNAPPNDSGSLGTLPHFGKESINESKEVPKPEVHRAHSQTPVIRSITAVMLRSWTAKASRSRLCPIYIRP